MNDDSILLNYAEEEDKWNEYVEKTIDFNNNYSIYTNKKKIADDSLIPINKNDTELTPILNKIRIKQNEINNVIKIIANLNDKRTESVQKQSEIITNANNDGLLDTYDIEDVKTDKKIENITDLNIHKKNTEYNLKELHNFSSYKNLSISDITNIINNKLSIHSNVIADINNINGIINKINDNNYTSINYNSDDSQLQIKYNYYNELINKINEQYTSLSTTTISPSVNTLQKEINSYQQQINTTNSKLSQSQTTLTQYKNTRNTKTKTLNNLNKELGEVNKSIATKTNELNNINCSKSSNKQSCNSRKNSLTQDISNLNARRKIIERDVQTLNREIETLNTNISAMENTTIPGYNTNISTYNNEKLIRTNRINTYNNTVSEINNKITALKINITTLKNELTNIKTNKTNNNKVYLNEINMYKNSRLYNRTYTKLNKINLYINEFNLYDIPSIDAKIAQQTVIKTTKETEKNKLIETKKNKIVELNNNMKTCKTNKDDLNNKLNEFKEHIDVCNSADMCTNKCAKNILCKVNEMFCSDESWYSILKSQYIQYFYDLSCSKIINKNVEGVVEPFANINEGFQNKQIFVNPNIDTDISYTNYYSKFITNNLHPEDISQNMLNLKRNIEIDTYFYLKYRAQIELLKYIIIICCILLLGSVFYHNGLITSDIYTMYLSVIFGISILFITYRVYDIFIRDDNNFNIFAFEKLFSPSNNVNNKYKVDDDSDKDCS